MKDVRILQIMKQYNIGLTTICDFLRNHGIKIANISINTKIPVSYVELIDSEFSKSAAQHVSATTIISNFKQTRRIQSTQARVNRIGRETVKEQPQNQTVANRTSFTESSRIAKENESQIKRRRKERKSQRKTNNSPVVPTSKEITPAHPITYYTYRTISDINECVLVKWRDITFYNGKIAFTYNKMRYYIDVDIAKESFNYIIKTFARRLPSIQVRIVNSIASLIDIIEFEKVICILKFQYHIFNVESLGYTNVSIDIFKSTPKNILRLLYPIDKTDYINYLQNQQCNTYPIIPTFESRRDIPDGFIFTIKQNSQMFLIWESGEQHYHKASYIFRVKESEVHNAQQLLFDYIISKIKNKRLALRANCIHEFVGIEYSYIDHDGYSTWKAKLDNFLNAEITSNKSKREDTVSFEICNATRSYTPIHNIIQNGLKLILENCGDYKSVLLESDHVDIKALTNNDEWHYYEVKTSTPRLCIREALGQILEYTHFNCHENVTELFIVGQYEPNEQEVKYISLLKQIYNLPICYQWYDIATNLLHK